MVPPISETAIVVGLFEGFQHHHKAVLLGMAQLPNPLGANPCNVGTPANGIQPSWRTQLKFHYLVRYSGWWFGIFFIFLYIGNNHPNWFSYFSER